VFINVQTEVFLIGYGYCSELLYCIFDLVQDWTY